MEAPIAKTIEDVRPWTVEQLEAFIWSNDKNADLDHTTEDDLRGWCIAMILERECNYEQPFETLLAQGDALVASWKEADVAASVEQAKSEILADIREGRLPKRIASFQDLHAHVDANTYGGLCDETSRFSKFSIDQQNEVQNRVDAWLKSKSRVIVVIRPHSGDTKSVKVVQMDGTSWHALFAPTDEGVVTEVSALKAWREDTNSGRRLHRNWTRT